MPGSRGYATAAVVLAVVPAGTAATAQTPTAAVPLSISVKLSPAVQAADFDRTVTLSGRVSGGSAVTAALRRRQLELELDAVALGYDRPLDLEPIVPRSDGRFRRKVDVAVNTRIVLRPPAGGAFTGASAPVTTHWRPLPEISNYTRGKRLVVEYRVSVPGGIPFARGPLKIRRGTARRAFFYAGACGRLTASGTCSNVRSRIRRIGSAPLRSAYDGEVHARLSAPFSALPKVPRGRGGRLYACLKGQAFLGTDPVDRSCGRRTTTMRIPPRT